MDLTKRNPGAGNTGETAWHGRSYCRTLYALIRVCGPSAGEMDGTAVATLEGLPNWIGGRPG